MKTFKALTIHEALARFENWSIRNLHQSFTIEKFRSVCESIKTTRSPQALTDIAFFIQYSYIVDPDYITIMHNVISDLHNFSSAPYQMKTAGYQQMYLDRLSQDEQNNVRLKDTAMISAILSDHFMKSIVTTTHKDYIDVAEQIANAAIQIFDMQSQKPGDLDWDEYLILNNITSWDEWVITQGEQILRIETQIKEAY